MMNTTSPAYVILGAAGGIGSAVCRMLASKGAWLLLVGQTAAKLEALAEELNGLNPDGDYRSRVADATKSADIDSSFTQAVERFGPLAGAANLVAQNRAASVSCVWIRCAALRAGRVSDVRIGQ